MSKKPKKECYLDLLCQIDKLDMQVEGIKDQLKNLKQLIIGTNTKSKTRGAPSDTTPTKENTLND